MKVVEWNAWCPFEIGDKVMIEGGLGPYEITDIATTHYARSGKTVFMYELNNNGYYQQMKILDKSDKGET